MIPKDPKWSEKILKEPNKKSLTIPKEPKRSQKILNDLKRC